MRKGTKILASLLVALSLTVTGCGGENDPVEASKSGVSWENLQVTDTMELQYASGFSVEDYGEDYSLLTIPESGAFLLVAEGATVPDDVPSDVVVLQKPLNHIYNASSSTMDLFRVIDGLDAISMTGTKAEDWSIPEIAKLVQSEEIIYAGKYSNPDYEYLVDDGCQLAIENTMIYHSPEVIETMATVGIPTMVERSSYEKHPLGRLEWVKLYGALLDKREAADAFFDNEIARIKKEVKEETATEKQSMVYFYITSTGAVNVRKPGDYVTKMISMAGGRYGIKGLEDDSDDNSTSVSIQMEAFYAYAKDADVLIYNGSINGSPESMEELLAMQPLLADFKAVKEHRVYCASGDMFQQVSGTCDMILDFYHVLRDEGDDELTYLYQLQ